MSTKREMTVAMAAPFTPQAGKPRLPKISSQLPSRLVKTAAMPAFMGSMLSPVSRMVVP